MPKVSVIIPIYGVEPYIERCVRSLMEQTLDDIEYLFINDCTPDRSVEILNDVIKDYPARISQIRIIEMEQNSGQAAVRKKGIELATGEYVIHCDSDDYVDKNMYKLMYNKAIDGGYDIVVCDFNEIVDEYSSVKIGLTKDGADLVSDILMAKSWGSLWNKLVRNKIVNLPNIKVPVSNLAEDLVLSVQYCLFAHSIGYVHSPLYNYCRRSNSTLGGKNTDQVVKKFKEFKRNFDVTISAIEEAGKKRMYNGEIIHECLHIKNQLLPVLKQCNENLNLWKETYHEINPKVLPSKVFTFKEKLNFIITVVGLYPFYNKFVGK